MSTEYLVSQIVRGIESGSKERIPVCVFPTKELADEFIKTHRGRGRHLDVTPIQRVTSLPLAPQDEDMMTSWCLVY